MGARRHAAHRRQNGLVARLSPMASSPAANSPTTSVALPSPSPTPSPASSADPSTSDPSPTPAAPASKSTDPATSSSPPNSSASTQNSSSSSPSASSAASPSTPVSSSAVHPASSADSSSLAATPATTPHASVIVTQGVDSTLALTPTSSLAPSPSTTSRTVGGTNTGVIIGGVAGALAGIAILGFLIMWCMRRQQDRDVDDFDAQAFKRQSAILVDDPLEPPRSYNARPLTMVEHHNASPALAAQAGYGGQNFYGNYDGYGQQQPEMIQPAVPPQAFGAAPVGYAAYNDVPQQLTRQPSNAGYLTRQPSAAHGFAPPPVPPTSLDPHAHYIDLNRSSVSPYQAAQYADISRRLGTSDPNGHANPPSQSIDIPDDPLPSPFDDPVQPAGNAHAAMPAPVGHTTGLHQRPPTFYEEGDAYGGI